MRRRDFITLVSSATIAWPIPSYAQQSKPAKLGVLMGGVESDREARARYDAFVQTVQKLGWSAGQNLRLDVRWAANDGQIKSHAAGLIAFKPDVIFVHNTASIRAIRDQGSSTPIVFAILADPVGSGLVTNLARPNNGITGFTNFEFAASGKWLQLLRDIDPRVAKTAVIFNPKTAPYADGFLQPMSQAAAKLGMELAGSGVTDAASIERVVSALGRERGGGIVALPDFSLTVHRELIIALAARHRVPVIYPYRYFATNGGLISYGSDTVEQFRQAAAYVDRILKGANPADLPIQQPTKYELVVNLKAAKALGLEVPLILQQSADEVIE